MDACPRDKRLSQATLAPHHLMALLCNFREAAATKNQRKIIKDRSVVWITCKVFIYLFIFYRYSVCSGRDKPNRMYTAQVLNKT